jgi:hypothetical protein
VRRLVVLTDPQCRVCRRLREQVAREPAWVRLELGDRREPLVAAGGGEPPHLDLLVRDERGATWSGESAWRVLLWACKATRPLARTPVAAREARAEHDRQLATRTPWSCRAPPPGLPHAPGREPRPGVLGFLRDVLASLFTWSLVLVLFVLLVVTISGLCESFGAGLLAAAAALGLLLWLVTRRVPARPSV